MSEFNKGKFAVTMPHKSKLSIEKPKDGCIRKVHIDFKICASISCQNNEINSPTLKFFPFPTNKALAKSWAMKAGCEYAMESSNKISKHVLCSDHFADSYFEPSSNKTVFKTKTNPVPTIFKHVIADDIRADDHSSSNKIPKSIARLQVPFSNKVIMTTMKKVQKLKSTHNLVDLDSLQDAAHVTEIDPLQIDVPVEQQTLTNADVIIDNNDFGNLKYTDDVYEEFVRNPSVLNVRSDAGDRVTCRTYCRLCARVVAIASLISIYTDCESVKYTKILEDCLPGMISKEDDLPHNICRPCLTKLEYCSVTLKAFKKANNKLKILLNSINIDEPYSCIINSKTDSNIAETIQKTPIPHLPSLNDSFSVETPRKSISINTTEPTSIVSKKSTPSDGTKYECLLCSSLFDVKKDLIDHSLKVHPTPNRNQIVCKVIQTKNATKSIESKETLKQTKNALKYECINCLKLYEVENDMINHCLKEHPTSNQQSKIVCKVIKTTTGDCGKRVAVDSKIVTEIDISAKALNLEQQNNIKYECLICGSLHDKKHTLVKHTMEFHPMPTAGRVVCRIVRTEESKRRTVKCLKCNTKFTDMKNYRKHMRSHLTFKCEECGLVFNRIFKLKHHRKVHKNETTKQCDVCNETFQTKTALVKHQKVVHKKKTDNDEGVANTKSDKSCLCNICGKLFPNKHYLQRHILIHGDERSHACKICAKRFKQKSTLVRHIQTHSRVFNFICQTCGKQFRTVVGLKQHLVIHNETRPYMCDLCGKQYLRGADLAKHKSRHEKPIVMPHSCRICHKAYPSKSSLKFHMSLHGEKLYKCELCNKQLASKVQYIVHCRIHTGELPYSCDVCNKSFRSKPFLKQHQAIHQDIYRYRCDVCSKDFKRLRSLNAHTRMHTGEKKYQCTDCNSRFSQKSDMVRHLRTHCKHQPILKDGSYYFMNEDDVVEETVVDSMSDLEIATQSILKLSNDLPIVESVEIPTRSPFKIPVNQLYTRDIACNSILKSLLE